ncbi:MAG: helix-turn-helix domain-containing protein [Magnetococcales bacterium]|nr:helix-turn-helix domain-containing protein [Magnetococcales bacterium]
MEKPDAFVNHLTLDEAAAFIGAKVSALSKMLKNGEAPAHYITPWCDAGKVWFHPDDIASWLERSVKVMVVQQQPLHVQGLEETLDLPAVPKGRAKR